MKKLHFTYDMQIDYSIEVTNCNFTIKCIPEDTLRQKIENKKITMYPETTYEWGKDGFKNTQIWGVNAMKHSSFRFQIEGDALTGLSDYEENADEDLAMLFAHPYGLNTPGDTIRNFYCNHIEKITGHTADKAVEIMQSLFLNFKYQAGVTNMSTSAEEAFLNGSGVCQDYAHILIALLNLANIPARYVTGFIIGEGASHAWVEFLNDNKWYGIDPTNNKWVNDEYIKIGHGRDARDCLINRGIMHGGGFHTQRIDVNVQEVQKGGLI